jgi:hypothetical protein
MSDTLDVQIAADGYLAQLGEFRFAQAAPVMPDALSIGRLRPALLATMSQAPAALYQRLAAGLTGMADPFAAGVLAIQLGALVEHGQHPAMLGEAMVARLPGDLAAARRFVLRLADRDGNADPARAAPAALQAAASLEPVGAAAWAALGTLVPAAMAAWVRHAASRRAAARDHQLVQDARSLSRCSHCGYFIAELLSAADGVELVVLSPEQRKGFVVELEVVRNIAHLQALLEDALVGDPAEGWLDGPRIDPNIAAIARSEHLIERERSYAISWNLQHRGGIREKPGHLNLPTASATLPFEATVHDLLAMDGRGIVLMRPAGPIKRLCGAGNMFAPIHDALRSRVHVRKILDASEVDLWLSEL